MTKENCSELEIQIGQAQIECLKKRMEKFLSNAHIVMAALLDLDFEYSIEALASYRIDVNKKIEDQENVMLQN